MKSALNFVPPITFVLHQFAFSAFSMSHVPLLLRKKIPRDSGTLTRLLFLCLVSVSGIVATNMGLKYESSGIGAVLTYTQPLFVFCLAAPFLKEEVSAIKLLGAVLGFIGVAVLFLGKLGSFTPFSYSFPLLILGAFFWALTVVYYKGALSRVNPVVFNFFRVCIGCLPLAALSLLTFSFAFPMKDLYLGLLLYSSLGSVTVGFTIWTYLLKEEDATVLSASSFIVPIFALLFGWQLLGEDIGLTSVLGSGIILTGISLVNHKGATRTARSRGELEKP